MALAGPYRWKRLRLTPGSPNENKTAPGLLRVKVTGPLNKTADGFVLQVREFE